MLSGQRSVCITSAADLTGIIEVLAGMEEVLFPGSTARRAATEQALAAATWEHLVTSYQLATHFPLTLTKWLDRACLDEAVLKKRLVWLIHYVQSGVPLDSSKELLAAADQGHPPGTALWDMCPVC